MKENKKEQGITLIALVVTIIILLILAGITLKSILGDDGLIQEAKVASNSYESASSEEKINLENTRNRIREFREGGSGSGNDESNSVFDIKDSSGNPIGTNNIVNHYGEEVTYNGEKYQLFLADIEGKYSNGEPRMWLQHKEYVASPPSTFINTNEDLNNLNSIFWQVNPKLKSSYGEEVSQKTIDDIPGGIWVSLKLCNPDNWNSTYIKSEDIEKGLYAIGSASIEMFCDSYNQARGKVSSEADYFDVNVNKANGTYGYAVKPNTRNNSNLFNGYYYYQDCENYPILSSTRNGMYKIENNNYCLSSPALYYDQNCFIYSNGTNGGCINHGGISYSLGYRPVISVPTSFPMQFDEN